LDSTINSSKFYGRRKGRKLSLTANLALKEGGKYFIKQSNLEQNFLELFSYCKKKNNNIRNWVWKRRQLSTISKKLSGKPLHWS
jgi:hypothetical protein